VVFGTLVLVKATGEQTGGAFGLIDNVMPAKELALPPAEPPDMQRLMAIAAKYDIEILGPLPGR
jgi:hypothetical protein